MLPGICWGVSHNRRKKDLENDIQNLVSSIQTPEAQKVIAAGFQNRKLNSYYLVE